MYRVAMGVVIGTILSWTGCCHPRCRHGVLLRGDWSLELNRVPWLANRSLSEQDCSEGCTAECGLPARDALADKPPEGGANQECLIGQRCRYPLCHSSDTYSAVTESSCPAHPRLHPVPTRPVFTPQLPAALAIAPLPSEPALKNPGQPVRPAAESGGPEAMPEVIPPPQSKMSSSPTAPNESQADSSGTNWVFSLNWPKTATETPTASKAIGRKSLSDNPAATIR